MATAKKASAPPNELPIALIAHGDNPRTDLDGGRLTSLTDSVRQHGVLQPIRVRRLPDESYQIIAGHRRFEAAREAGLTVIPVYVSQPVDDDEAFVQSLVENIQREDLDPLDEARAYQAILERSGWTQVELGKKVGKAQSTVSNVLGLLELTPKVQSHLSAGDLTVGHAKVLSAMPAEKQETVAATVIDQKMSVRDTEALAARDRQQVEAEAARAVAVGKHADVAHLLLTEQGVDVNAVIVVYDRAVATKLADMGWSFAREVNYRTDSTFPTWTCECDAFWFVTATENRDADVKRCCVVKAHEKAAKKDEDAANRATQKDNENLLHRQQRAAVKELRAADADQLTDDGLRLTLYTVLMSDEAFSYGRDDRRGSFVRRHGGTWTNDVTKSGEEVWTAIEGLSSKDLVNEILDRVVDLVIPNVFSQSEFYNRSHAAARAWMVKQLDLDPSLVWGNKVDAKHTYPELDDEPIVAPVEGWDDNAPDAIDEANLDAQEAVESDMFDALKEAGLSDSMAPDDHPDALAAIEAVAEPFIDAPDPVTTRALDGEKVVVTGVVMGMTRDEVMTAVVNAGGQWGESVNKNTTLVVVGTKPGGAKTRKAEELGIPTLTESEFRERLG